MNDFEWNENVVDLTPYLATKAENRENGIEEKVFDKDDPEIRKLYVKMIIGYTDQQRDLEYEGKMM